MELPRKTTSFMALLWCASSFMHDRKTNLLHRPGEDLITRIRDHENWGHIVNFGHYNKLWGL